MKHQRILAAFLFAFATFAVLPSANVTLPEKTFSVCRANVIDEFQDIENDAYLAAVSAEVSAFAAADPNLTVTELVDALEQSHTAIFKVHEQLEYFYVQDHNGNIRRVCRETTVVAIIDPTQIVPVHVRIENTVDV